MKGKDKQQKVKTAKKNDFGNKRITGSAFATPVIYAIAILVLYYIILNNRVHNSEFDIAMFGGIVTVIFTIIMFLVIFFEAHFCRKKLISITKALSNNVKDGKDSYGKTLIQNAISKYNTANIKVMSKNKNSVLHDISEFVGMDMIAESVHTSFSEQIGNVMTGLGILGTFVGLTIGLEKFNSQDAFVSTPVLLNGIKVAFYTSIFGVTGSLIFNYFYHKDVEACECALFKFYESFYSTVPSAEHDYYNKMISLNEKQTEALETLAGSIAGRLEEKLPEKLAEAVDNCIKPTMEDLKQSIYDNIMKSVDAQSETLGKLVDKFMKQLNKSLDDQFINLAKSIKEMCEWQGNVTEKLKSIMTSLDETANNISKLSIDTEHAEASRKAMTESTNKMFDRAVRYVDAFEAYRQEVRKWTEEIAEYKMPLMEQKEMIDSVMDQNGEIQDEIKKMIIILDKYQKQSEEMNTKQNQVNEMMRSAANQIKNTASSMLDETNGKMDKINKNVEDSAKFYLNGLENIKSSVTNTANDLKSTIEKTEKDVKAVIDKVAKENEASSGATKQMADVLSESIDKVSKKIEQNTEKIIEANKINRGFSLFGRNNDNE